MRWGLLTAAMTIPFAVLSLDVIRSDDTLAVDRWLQQLGSDSFIQRDFAARQLQSQAASITAQLAKIARTGNPQAARTAVDLLSRVAADEDAANGAAAHRVLAQLANEDNTLSPGLRRHAVDALRGADRHVVGIVAALGGEVERDESLAIIALHVHDGRLTDRHAMLLSRLTSLRELDLRATGISNDALSEIAKLPHLQVLNLADTLVTGRGLQQLKPLTNLRELVLYRVPITPDDFDWFSKQFPDLMIRR